MIVKINNEKIFNALSELLSEAADYEDEFPEFALENEHAVKVALYASSVLDGYAIASDSLATECEKSLDLFKTFLEGLESEDI
jgi:hypothetical protein